MIQKQEQGNLNCKLHENKQIELFCTYLNCEKDNRYLCGLCIYDDIHRHKQLNNNHLKQFHKLDISFKDIITDVRQQVILNHSNYKEKLQKLKQLALQIQENLQVILQKINDFEFNPISDEDEQKFNKLLAQTQDPQNYFNEQYTNEVMNLNKQEFNKQRNIQLQDAFQTIQTKFLDIQKNGAGLFKSQPHQTLYKYQPKTIMKLKKHYIHAVQISPDYKYIVAGGTQKQLQIWNTDTLKQTRYNIELQKGESVYIIKFTEDSAIMNIGTLNGNIYQFDVNNHFKQINCLTIHQNAVLNIICVNNSTTISSDGSGHIIKYDFPAKQKLFDIQAHDDRTDGLDYDHIRELIVSGSQDKSIKIWNADNGKLVLDRADAADVTIQNNAISITRFLRNQDKIISLDTGHYVIIWSILFEQKELEISLRISDYYIITNVSMVLQDQYILLLCKQYLKLYSTKGEYIRTIQHYLQDFSKYYTYTLVLSNTIQDQTMQILTVKGQNQLQIFKAIK